MRVPRHSTVFLILSLTLVVLFPGCNQGPDKPADLPPLRSCTLTIMHKGSPVSDATVTLVPKSGNWVGAGQTDADGRAVVRTNGRYEGVPSGTYTVTVTKYEQAGAQVSSPRTAEEDKAYSEATKSTKPARLLIPQKYTKPETSGLTVSVSDSSVSETFQLAD